MKPVDCGLVCMRCNKTWNEVLEEKGRRDTNRWQSVEMTQIQYESELG